MLFCIKGGVTQRPRVKPTKRSGPKPPGLPRPCSDLADDRRYAKHCRRFPGSCKDNRYPWFKNLCKKTCCNRPAGSNAVRLH